MKCTTCPHDVGDASERDCAFPDCSGGWEQVYLDSQERIAELEADNLEKDAEIERLRANLTSLGDAVIDMFEQMIKGNWKDDHDHDVHMNRAMISCKDAMESVMEALKPQDNSEQEGE